VAAVLPEESRVDHAAKGGRLYDSESTSSATDEANASRAYWCETAEVVGVNTGGEHGLVAS
jgi:hypothetical protein